MKPPLKQKSPHLKIAFAYDRPGSGNTVDAEYEDQPTIDWMRDTLKEIGAAADIPWSGRFIEELMNAEPDVIFNITEGSAGRNRESLVPAVAEAAGIPCTGSDAVGLGISLDKGITKLVAREIGIPTPDFRIFYTPGELETCLSEEELSYPLLIKPNSGGSSLGIRQKSKVYSPEELLREGERIFTECGDSVLAEVFIPGREFASAVFNRGDGPEMLPAAEIRLAGGDPESFYHLDMKSRHQKEVICPAELPERIRKEMDESALHLFNRLGLKDLARIDYRLDRNGKLWMLEINPLPGLSPFYSVFPVQAKAAGIAPEEIIHQLIYNNLRGRNGKQRLEMAGKKHNPVHGRTE